VLSERRIDAHTAKGAGNVTLKFSIQSNDMPTHEVMVLLQRGGMAELLDKFAAETKTLLEAALPLSEEELHEGRLRALLKAEKDNVELRQRVAELAKIVMDRRGGSTT